MDGWKHFRGGLDNKSTSHGLEHTHPHTQTLTLTSLSSHSHPHPPLILFYQQLGFEATHFHFHTISSPSHILTLSHPHSHLTLLHPHILTLTSSLTFSHSNPHPLTSSLIFSHSHPHILTSSHPHHHTFSHSHPHSHHHPLTFSHSHPHIVTPSHPHSHSHTSTPPHILTHIVTSHPHPLTLPSSQRTQQAPIQCTQYLRVMKSCSTSPLSSPTPAATNSRYITSYDHVFCDVHAPLSSVCSAFSIL